MSLPSCVKSLQFRTKPFLTTAYRANLHIEKNVIFLVVSVGKVCMNAIEKIGKMCYAMYSLKYRR